MWTGNATIRPGWAVFRGTAGDHTRHRHHAVQMAIGITGPVELWAESPGGLLAPGVVIPADCTHQLASGPDPILLLYLERESSPGRALDDWCAGQARPLSNAQNRRMRGLLGNPAETRPNVVGEILVSVLGAVPSEKQKAFSDERIARSIAAFPRPLPQSLTAAVLARQSDLSPSRYAHLFRTHTGMALRPYLRWLKLQQALSEVARGANLTQAAHAAGFSDSAHLSRTFRKTFGIPPNVLLHPAMSLEAGTG